MGGQGCAAVSSPRGAGGRLASTTSAVGTSAAFTSSYAYDIAGRTLKQSYTRLLSDGVTCAYRKPHPDGIRV